MPQYQPQRIEYQLMFGISYPFSIRNIFWTVLVLMSVVYNSFDHFTKKGKLPCRIFHFWISNAFRLVFVDAIKLARQNGAYLHEGNAWIEKY